MITREAHNDPILRRCPTKPLHRLGYRIIDGEAALVNLDRNTLHLLNQTGTRIWQAIDGNTTLISIITILSDEFEVDRATLERDCVAFVEEMIDAGLLVLE